MRLLHANNMGLLFNELATPFAFDILLGLLLLSGCCILILFFFDVIFKIWLVQKYKKLGKIEKGFVTDKRMQQQENKRKKMRLFFNGIVPSK